MDDRTVAVLTSELTLLEWSSALASVCRQQQMDYATFKANELALMTDVADGKLGILPLSRSVERARYLIEYAGVVERRGLRTGDAIQLLTALGAASSLRRVVTFVTCDRTLANIVHDLAPFRPYLRDLFLQP